MTGGRSEKAMSEARKLYKSLDESFFLNNIAPSSTDVQDGKLRFGVLFRMVTVSLGLIVFSQLSGFSAVMFYSIQVAHKSGLGSSSTDLFLVSEGIFLSNVLGVIWSLCVIDKLGRKKTLLASQIGSVLSLLVVILSISLVDLPYTGTLTSPLYVSSRCRLSHCTACAATPHCGICLFNSSSGSTEGFCTDASATHGSLLDRCEISGGTFTPSYCPSHSNYILLIALAAFVVFFSLGLAPIPFMYASEIFPQRYRDVLTGISISTYYSLTAFVTLAFGVLYPVLGISHMFTIFLVATLAGFFFTLLYTPDISGKSLENAHLQFREPWFNQGVDGGSGDYVAIPGEH